MDEHGECEHTGGVLEPAWCYLCINGPDLPIKAKPQKPKKASKVKLPVDPEELALQEYLSGARCTVCDGLRTGSAKQCQHVRDEIIRANIEEIEAWAAAHPDKKGMFAMTAAAGSISRVTLRGGLRNAPTGIAGLSMGSLIGLSNRVGHGKNMEWKPNSFRSGDELPV